MPIWYEIQVSNRLDPQSLVWFDGMLVTAVEGTNPPQTVIRGYVRDQAALYGLISRVRDLGLTLVSVNPRDMAPNAIDQTRRRKGEEMAEICVVGVYVRDLEKAKEFYCDKLGFEIAREYGDSILQLRNAGVTFIIEEIQGDFPKEPCMTIGIATENLEQESERLRSLGVAFIHDTPQPFPEGNFATCQDADGHLIELLQFRE